MNGSSPRFTPLRPAPSRARVAILLVGPLLWIASLIVVGVVTRHTNQIGVGLLIVAVSFAVSIPVMLVSRRRRVLDARKGERADAG